LLEESFTASELTFSQRIDAFADIFRRSKNRVKNLLRGDLIGEYMLVPGNVMKNTLQNIKHNQNRQGILEEHREQWMQERNMVVKKRGMKKTPRTAGMLPAHRPTIPDILLTRDSIERPRTGWYNSRSGALG
jgi:hypothetical protein